MSAKRQVRNFDGERFLATHPVFTRETLVRAMGGRNAAQRALFWTQYHQRAGRLLSVEKGVFAHVPPGASPDKLSPDAFLVAAAVRPDGVFGYHSALELLGAGHSVWNVVTIMSSQRRKPLPLTRARVEFLPHPAPLVKRGQERLGVRRGERLGAPMAVTGPERTLVDGFRSLQRVGGIEELVESAAGFGTLDLKLLRRALEVYGQKAIFGAVGWFLERYQKRFFVPDSYLESLERNRPSSPHYLPRHRRGQGGVLVSRWNLVLPQSVAGTRASGEP